MSKIIQHLANRALRTKQDRLNLLFQVDQPFSGIIDSKHNYYSVSKECVEKNPSVSLLDEAHINEGLSYTFDAMIIDRPVQKLEFATRNSNQLHIPLLILYLDEDQSKPERKLIYSQQQIRAIHLAAHPDYAKSCFVNNYLLLETYWDTQINELLYKESTV